MADWSKSFHRWSCWSRCLKKYFFQIFLFNFPLFFHVLVEVGISKGAVLSTRGAKTYKFTRVHRCNQWCTGRPVRSDALNIVTPEYQFSHHWKYWSKSRVIKFLVTLQVIKVQNWSTYGVHQHHIRHLLLSTSLILNLDAQYVN